MRIAFILFISILSITSGAFAQPLTRAEAVAQALAANPQVKLSLEQVALLEGRIVEARADALSGSYVEHAGDAVAQSRTAEQPELRCVSAENSATR